MRHDYTVIKLFLTGGLHNGARVLASCGWRVAALGMEWLPRGVGGGGMRSHGEAGGGLGVRPGSGHGVGLQGEEPRKGAGPNRMELGGRVTTVPGEEVESRELGCRVSRVSDVDKEGLVRGESAGRLGDCSLERGTIWEDKGRTARGVKGQQGGPSNVRFPTEQRGRAL